jgi:hypothetical protein
VNLVPRLATAQNTGKQQKKPPAKPSSWPVLSAIASRGQILSGNKRLKLLIGGRRSDNIHDHIEQTVNHVAKPTEYLSRALPRAPLRPAHRDGLEYDISGHGYLHNIGRLSSGGRDASSLRPTHCLIPRRSQISASFRSAVPCPSAETDPQSALRLFDPKAVSFRAGCFEFEHFGTPVWLQLIGILSVVGECRLAYQHGL